MMVRKSVLYVAGYLTGGGWGKTEYDISDAQLEDIGPNPSRKDLLRWCRRELVDFNGLTDVGADFSYPDGHDIQIAKAKASGPDL